MTNKDAIYILSGLKRSLNEYCGLNNNGQKAFDMAISALQAQEAKNSNESSLTQNGLDTISRQAAIDEIRKCRFVVDAIEKIIGLPSAQPESCDECKHLGKWENEVEYGYPSPCTHCKRRARDHYER